MVEVDKVADRVDGGEEQGGAGADLVELEARVQRDILGMTMLVVVVIVMIVMMIVDGPGGGDDGDDSAGAELVEYSIICTLKSVGLICVKVQ